MAVIINDNEKTKTLKGVANEDNQITGYNGVLAENITGGKLNDTITGNGGNDTITGGTGTTTVNYTKGDGNDVINLTKGENFTLVLNGIPGNDIDNIKFDYLGRDLIIFTSKYSTDIKTSEYITLKNFAGTDVTNNSTRTAPDTSSVLLNIGGKTYDLKTSQDVTDPNNPVPIDLFVFNLGKGSKNFTGTYHKEVINASSYKVEDTTGNDINTWHADYAKTKGLNLNGGAGNDSIIGSIYADTLIGGDGNDTISAGYGADSIQGGNGKDTITGGYGNDTISGGAGADRFEFSKDDGSDTITDADNTDTIKVSDVVKTDFRYGKNGNNLEIYYDDTYDENNRITVKDYFSKKAEQRITTLLDKNDEAVPLANIDYVLTGNGRVTGTNGNDVIYGSSANDNLQGGKGDDTIYGRNGKDTIVGGDGNDSIIGGLGADSITGGTGTNVIKYNSYNEMDGDKIVLTKGENLLIDLSSFAYAVDYKINGSNLDITYNDKTLSIMNFGKTDVTNNSTKTSADSSSVKLQLSGGGEPVDLRIVTKSFRVDKNYTGTWHKENIDASAYRVYKNSVEIDESHADYAKTRGLNLNGGLNDDTIRGTIYADTLLGGDGDDSIYGSKGNDVITGGKGVNNIYYSYANFGNDTINLTKDEILNISGISEINYEQSKNDLLVRCAQGTILIKNYYGTNTGATVKIEGVNLAAYPHLPEVNSTYFYDSEKSKYIQTKYKGSALADSISAAGLTVPTKTTVTKTDTIKTGVTIDTGYGNDSIIGSQFNDTILAGEGNDTISAGLGADSITGGLGENVIKYNNEYQLDGDKITLTKGEDLTIDVRGFGSQSNISYKINGANLDVTVNGKTFTLLNYGKTDVTNNATKTTENTGRVRIQIGNESFLDLEKEVKSFSVNKNYTGTWHKENIDASEYRALNRNKEEIEVGDADYAKTRGLNINGGLNDDSIKGTIYNDTLIGGAGNDTLRGGKGNDSLQGVEGDNTFFFSAGDGHDTITAGKGNNDTIELYAVTGEVKFAQDTKNKRDLVIRYNGTQETGFTDSITIKNYFKTADRTAVTSSVSNIIINGKSPSESLEALAKGQKTVEVTTVIGELDEDGNFEQIDDKSYVVTGDDRANTIQTGTGDDIIDAGNGNNNVSTTGGSNLITTGDGKDTISVGGSGDNTITSGAGNNVITVNSSGTNTITAGTGIDSITLNAGTNYVKTGGNTDSIIISAGTNVIDATNSTENVTITGGNNTINGATWNSTYRINGGTTEVNAVDGQEDGILANIQSGALTSTDSKDRVTISGAGVALDTRDGNDSIYADTQNNTISAGAGNDYIQITASNNTVDMGAGNDTIRVNTAETENITISAGAGNDSINVNSNGAVTVDGGAGNDTISVNGTGKIIYGGTGADTIGVNWASTGNNTIYGGSDTLGTDDSKNEINAQNMGNNTIYGGNAGDSIYAGYNDGGTYKGNNSIVGGEGDDYISASQSASATISAGAGNDTIYGSLNGNSTIDGSAGNDDIVVYGSNNVVDGGAGDDNIYSGEYTSVSTNNTITGGTGNDTISLKTKVAETLVFRKGDGNDNILLSNSTPEGNDTLVFEDSELNELYTSFNGNDLIITYNKNAETPDSVKLTEFIPRYNNETNTVTTIKYKDGEGFDTISITDFINSRSIIDVTGTSYSGSLFNETINGSAGAESLYGGAGNDSISGNAGDDYLNGGYGNDTIRGGEGNDTINDYDGSNLIYGDAGNDSISGSGTIYGGIGNDYLNGGEGDNSLSGDDGNDSIYAGSGNDSISGGTGNDSLTGNEGNDTIQGGEGNDIIYGNDGADVLYGGKGYDTLYGYNDDDVLYADGEESLEGGEANSSSLIGGRGNDTLYGGSGNDSLYGDENGGEGNDVIYARYGNNYVVGGAGDDAIYSGTGNDNFWFSGNNTDGIDTIYSGSGNDTITINQTFYSDTSEDATEKGYTKDGNNLVIAPNEDSKIILNNYFTAGSSVDYIKYNGNAKLLSDMKIYQQGVEHGDDGDTLTALEAHNDFIEGTDKADSITAVGLGSHNDTINYTINDLVIAGKGNDTINISDNGYAEIRIENGDGDDVITNVSNAKRVLIKFENDADNIRGYQKGADYIIERYWKADEVWHTETTTLQGFTYEAETTKLALKTMYGSDIPLSSIHVAEYVSPKEFKRALDNQFTTLASDPISYFVQGSGYADTVTTGLGDDFIYAYDANNLVNAGNGNNLVETGNVDDTIYSGTGNDTIHAGSGSNLITIAGGNNEVTTSNELNDNYWDTITINGSGTNTVNAGGGRNQVSIAGGSNTIITGYGSDTITIGDGTNGTNVINSAGGNNTIDVYGAENTITTGSSADTITARGTTSNTITTSGYSNRITVEGNNANVTVTEGNQDTITLTSGGTNTVTAEGDYHRISTSSGDNTITLNGDQNNVTIAGAGANNVSVTSDGYLNQIIVNSTGTSTITGSSSKDYITVNAGTNIINATGGNDDITIKDGSNTLNIGDAIDARVYVQEGESTNTINDGAGNNSYNLYTGTTTLNLNGIDGDNYSDTVSAFGGTNTINGTAYHDVMNIYSGENTVNLGAGNDLIYINNPDTLPASTNTIYGGLGSDTIRAIYANNTIYGGQAPELGDTISVDNASNSIYIGGTSAQVHAGSYGDSIYADRSITSATVYGGAGDDTIGLAQAGTVLVEAGTGNDSIIGTKSGNSTIDGGAGDDTIEVYTGNSNSIVGGAGNDHIYIGNDAYDGQKYATITGGTGNDTISLHGTFIETLEFNAGDGHDFIDSSSSEDILKFNGINLDDITVTYNNSGDHETVIKYNGGADSVTLYGTHPLFNKIITADYPAGIGFTDFMNQRSITELEPQSTIEGASYNGNQYNESITGTDLGDTILGRAGNDTIYGGDGNDSISGENDNDILYGDAGNDTLDGYLGNDTIYGGAGNDEIDDDYGRNTIYGGAGNDTIDAHLYEAGTVLEGDYQTLIFTSGDGTDTVKDYSQYGSLHTTLQFNGIDDYADLNISYEYDNENNWSDLVIQYGANEDDKVILQNYSVANSSNVNIKIDDKDLTDLNTILSDKHIILPTDDWNSTVEGSASDDYIYANNGNNTIIGGAGDDTIESIGHASSVTYKFSRNGDGDDVIINSDIGGYKIVFTGFTEEEHNKGYAFYSKYLTDNVHYLMDGDDLVISYGETTPSTIRVNNYGYMGAGSHIEYIIMEDSRGWTTNIPIENVLQLRADVEEGVEFIGDNNINQYVVGTSGNDTINAGAGKPYADDYRIGGNVISPMTGQDTIILANCYDNEEQLITTAQTLRINMGDTYSTGADLLWFKDINSISDLDITYDDGDLIITTNLDNITPHKVIIRNYQSSLDPSFSTIKVGTDGLTSFTIAELAEDNDFYFFIDNRGEYGLSTIQGSVLNDYVYTSATLAESIIGSTGNDTIDAIFESLQKDPQADTIHGGLGDDSINYAAYGNDGLEIYGDEGNDKISIAGGAAYGGVGSDDIWISDDNDYYEEHGTFRTVTIYGGTSDGIGESADDADTISASSYGNTHIEAHGGIGTNQIGTGAGNDTIYGNAQSDTISAYDGDDIIYGYAGNDSIDGGRGDNYIDGGAGDDTVIGYDGYYNTLIGGAGNDSILATNTTDINHVHTTRLTGESTIHAGAGNDTIWTRCTSNEIWSDEGDDIIYTANNSKTTFHFKSGDGNDSIYSSQKSVSIDSDIIILDDIEYTGDNIKGHFDTTNNLAIIEYKNNETGEWDSSITIDKYLMATSGTAISTDGSNTGRWSSIEYIVDKTGKKIALKNILTYPEKTGITNNYSYTILSDNITYGATYAMTYWGGQGSDTLTGTSYADTIYGDMNTDTGLILASSIVDPGDDYIDGKGGANVLYGGAGNDTIVTGNDNNTDTIYGGAGANTYNIKSYSTSYAVLAEINSVSEADTLNFIDVSSGSSLQFAKDSNDLVITYYGGSKYDKVKVKDYFDKLYNYDIKTQAGTVKLHDLMYSNSFTNTSKVTGNTETSSTKTIKIGSDGADTISAYGSSGNTIIGGAGNDSITGTSSGDDVINGGDGDDIIKQASGVIYGGNGNDTITNLWEASTIYGGAGADSINGSNYDGENDLIFTGGKPTGDLANYTDLVYYEGYVDIYEGFGEADANSMVYGYKGNDTICAFGENVKEIDGGSGNDSFHTMLTNNVKISDGYGTDTLQLHSVSRAEQAYIVMNADSDGDLSSLYVVNKENYLDWLENNGSFSEGHGGVKLYATDSVDTITSSENYYTTTSDLNSLKSDIASWLDTDGCGDVAEALANSENKDELIAIFNNFNSHTDGGWTAV